jgi:hypothetical protein
LFGFDAMVTMERRQRYWLAGSEGRQDSFQHSHVRIALYTKILIRFDEALAA